MYFSYLYFNYFTTLDFSVYSVLKLHDINCCYYVKYSRREEHNYLLKLWRVILC